MKLVHSLMQRWKKSKAPKKVTGRIVVTHWDRENLYFFISSSKSQRIRAQDAGVLAYPPQQSPLVALSDFFRRQEIAVQQLVVLLSRPELEQLTLNLPPADEEELPTLVASAVEQQLGDSESPPTVDFCTLPVIRTEAESTGIPVLAFALTANSLQSLQAEAAQAGFKLIAIASRQLAALSLLSRLPDLTPMLNIVLHLYPGEVELAFCIGAQPQLLRSVRVNLDELDRTVEQLLRETQRCLTLLPPEVEELPQQWMVFDTCRAAQQISPLIRQAVEGQVTCIDPLWQWDFSGSFQVLGRDAVSPSATASASTAQTSTAQASTAQASTAQEENPNQADGFDRADWSLVVAGQDESLLPVAPTSLDEPSEQPTNEPLPSRADAVTRPTAALTGAAWEIWHGGLSINLISPKRAPQAPNPWFRPAAWSAAGLLVTLLAGYALKTDVWHLQHQVVTMQEQVQESGKLAAKLLEKSDQTKLVENWLSDQIDWLAVLDEVSQRLPAGQDACVSRLTASSDGNQGILDLSVQVTDPEKITQLEERLRSVKYSVNSKRISQSPEASEYPWRFETRITFPIELIDWRNYSSNSSRNSKPTNAKTQQFSGQVPSGKSKATSKQKTEPAS